MDTTNTAAAAEYLPRFTIEYRSPSHSTWVPLYMDALSDRFPDGWESPEEAEFAFFSWAHCRAYWPHREIRIAEVRHD